MITDGLEDASYSDRRTHKEPRNDQTNHRTQNSVDLQRKDVPNYPTGEDRQEVSWNNQDRCRREEMNMDCRDRFMARKGVKSTIPIDEPEEIRYSVRRSYDEPQRNQGIHYVEKSLDPREKSHYSVRVNDQKIKPKDQDKYNCGDINAEERKGYMANINFSAAPRKHEPANFVIRNHKKPITQCKSYRMQDSFDIREKEKVQQLFYYGKRSR